jgi:hypothetical protein
LRAVRGVPTLVGKPRRWVPNLGSTKVGEKPLHAAGSFLAFSNFCGCILIRKLIAKGHCEKFGFLSFEAPGIVGALGERALPLVLFSWASVGSL